RPAYLRQPGHRDFRYHAPRHCAPDVVKLRRLLSERGFQDAHHHPPLQTRRAWRGLQPRRARLAPVSRKAIWQEPTATIRRVRESDLSPAGRLPRYWKDRAWRAAATTKDREWNRLAQR